MKNVRTPQGGIFFDLHCSYTMQISQTVIYEVQSLVARSLSKLLYLIS